MRYQLSNHLGTATLELAEDAAIISYEEYYPYGSTSFQSGRSAAEVSLKRYRYTGKERDEETGLNYHGARYYAPWLGRWLEVDPLESKFGTSSHYDYSNNNPIVLHDSTGLEPQSHEHDESKPQRTPNGGPSGGGGGSDGRDDDHNPGPRPGGNSGGDPEGKDKKNMVIVRRGNGPTRMGEHGEEVYGGDKRKEGVNGPIIAGAGPGDGGGTSSTPAPVQTQGVTPTTNAKEEDWSAASKSSKEINKKLAEKYGVQLGSDDKASDKRDDSSKKAQVKYGGHKVSSDALKDQLELFAKFVNKEIDVTGGDRGKAKNRSVGGVNDSRHLHGDAADIKVGGMDNLALARLANASGLFNTVIHYPTPTMQGALHAHVHVDKNPAHRNLFLKYVPVKLKIKTKDGKRDSVKHTYQAMK